MLNSDAFGGLLILFLFRMHLKKGIYSQRLRFFTAYLPQCLYSHKGTDILTPN